MKHKRLMKHKKCEDLWWRGYNFPDDVQESASSTCSELVIFIRTKGIIRDYYGPFINPTVLSMFLVDVHLGNDLTPYHAGVGNGSDILSWVAGPKNKNIAYEIRRLGEELATRLLSPLDQDHPEEPTSLKT